MKQQRIYIRVTEHEKLLLKERAKKTKKNLSEYILLMTLKKEVVFTSNEMLQEISELKKELRAVTNLRNQNSILKSSLDPIRTSIHSILKRFS
jgi:hypothetical protein